MKLIVGQRIDVYKIINNGGYGDDVFISGTFRPGEHRMLSVVDVLSNEGDTWAMIINKEITKVGTMVIKSLK